LVGRGFEREERWREKEKSGRGEIDKKEQERGNQAEAKCMPLAWESSELLWSFLSISKQKPSCHCAPTTKNGSVVHIHTLLLPAHSQLAGAGITVC
jgi:hypothetical protein